MSRKNYSFIDLMVIAFVVITIIQLLSDWIFMQLHPRSAFMSQNSASLSQTQILSILFVVLEIITFIIWLKVGVAESPVWKWLPPFCFFNWLKNWQKVAFVLLLVIIGIISLIKTLLIL